MFKTHHKLKVFLILDFVALLVLETKKSNYLKVKLLFFDRFIFALKPIHFFILVKKYNKHLPINKYNKACKSKDNCVKL